ncbi:alpha/beta hydrolase [Streptomyces sp. NBS 14/10]|uniref:alpha/beta fold hydrolase n=1 Tax=Streptomyces sp. NBS 14/10 TaxID=1945643 RepID=UPI000B7DC160|nr:alpha/beta hydrolase [Streptomyces sp. NBS 14/10]KAK1184369.1 alpha/beta hydrolase [Streptomyces sp. NBS 14/10]
MNSRHGRGRLAFEVTGNGDQPLLLLHGLGADRSQPLALADDTVRRQCQVLAPDLRAHGMTTLDERHELLTFPQLAADVEEVIGDFGPSRPLIVVGISMGAGVAAQLLARGNIPVRGLVLIRPVWRWEPHPASMSAYPRITELLRTHGAAKGRVLFQDSEDYAGIARVSAAAADALLGQFDAPRAVERAQRLTAVPASAPTRPPSSGTPKLVIGAHQDPVHPMIVAEQVAGDLGAPLKIVSPRYDAPEQHFVQVARAIRNFVQDV